MTAAAGDAYGLDRFADKLVVVDTSGSLVYIGRIAEADEHFVSLIEADVFDASMTTITKEQYLIEARSDGVIPTRSRVWIRQSVVQSISLLEDVRPF